MTFSFGAAKTTAATGTTTTTTAATGFQFGGLGTSTAASTSGFQFGNLGSTAPGLQFGGGLGSTATTTANVPFSFSTMQQPAAATTSLSGTLSFASPVSTTPAKSVGFTLPATTTTPAAAPTNFSLPTTAASSGFSLPATTAATGFSLPTTSAATGFSLPTTSSATGFSLPTTSAATGFSFSTTPNKSDAKKQVTFSLPSTTAAPSAPSVTSSGFSLGGTATTTASTIPPASTMTYGQIEELLNKWTTELADQEKVFNTQVLQINTWDKLLAENSSKLSKLNATVKKVQQQQEKINYDLDLIASQKKELEDALAPLEKEFASAGYHPDVQREKMYHTAESIDAQIKKMCEDVKETIEHVNEAARSEKMHPVVLIGRVLNAQMNSLQWVDEHSTQLQAQIESMTRQLDSVKRETDRSFISFS